MIVFRAFGQAYANALKGAPRAVAPAAREWRRRRSAARLRLRSLGARDAPPCTHDIARRLNALRWWVAVRAEAAKGGGKAGAGGAAAKKTARMIHGLTVHEAQQILGVT